VDDSDPSATVARRLEYDVVDVFTDRAFAGNPLAVVYGTDGLSGEQLAALANEFHLSETAFPISLTSADREAGADYRVRIFTPDVEIPFAGHPTLGAAWALRRRGSLVDGDVVQACGAGLIDVHVPSEGNEPIELGASPRDPARALTAAEVAAVVPLVGLSVEDVVGSAHLAGCGLTWLYLPVRPDTVPRSQAGSVKLSQVAVDAGGLLDPLDGIDVYAVVSPGSGSDEVQISSRVFIPGFGIPEDPATGSAAAGLGLVLVATGVAAPDGQTTYRVEQGRELGRPSVLGGRVQAAGGTATRVHVAGHVVHVASGTIATP
jgi:trans-2,3-dihydro-3-hydroxyanthranilate isomerase